MGLAVVVPGLSGDARGLAVAVQVVEDEGRADQPGQRQQQRRVGEQLAVGGELQFQQRGRPVPVGVGAGGDRAGPQTLVHPAVHLGDEAFAQRLGQQSGQDQVPGFQELTAVLGVEGLTPGGVHGHRRDPLLPVDGAHNGTRYGKGGTRVRPDFGWRRWSPSSPRTAEFGFAFRVRDRQRSPRRDTRQPRKVIRLRSMNRPSRPRQEQSQPVDTFPPPCRSAPAITRFPAHRKLRRSPAPVIRRRNSRCGRVAT